MPPSTPVADPREKNTLRRIAKARRAALPETLRISYSQAICCTVLASELYRNADGLLLYAAVNGEADLSMLAHRAMQDGKSIAYPRCNEDGRMVFYPAEPEQLVLGRYNIPAPSPSIPANLTAKTLCLVPGLLFDRCGHRLGMGGGYYDRFLPEFPGRAVGILYPEQLEEALPWEAHDASVFALAMPGGISVCPMAGDDEKEEHYGFEQ